MKSRVNLPFKKLFHSLGLKLGSSIGLIFLITFLSYAHFLSKAFTLSALFFSIGAIGMLGFCIFYFVERPIGKLRRSAREIASGDFSQPIEVRSSDEIGDLAAALEERRQKIKEITAALKTSQQEFQSLFENVPCYISVQDRNLRLLRVNRDFRKDFGENIGSHCYQVYKNRKGDAGAWRQATGSDAKIPRWVSSTGSWRAASAFSSRVR